MLNRPVVELEWAAKLTGGMTTITVPPLSVVTLPSAESFGWCDPKLTHFKLAQVAPIMNPHQ